MSNPENELVHIEGIKNAFSSIYYKTDPIKFRKVLVCHGQIYIPPNKNQKIVISGHSDYDITDSDVDFYRPSVWWCINKKTKNPNVHSFPMGIDNRLPNHSKNILEIMKLELPIKNLVYMNFDIRTFPPERQYVYDKFKDKPYVTVGSRCSELDFLKELKSHKFVLCPRGNGIDTHRLWEVLHIGSIPIVKRDIAMEDFYDMPICFIDSWDEVTEEFLQNFKLNPNANRDKLKMSHWIELINKSIV